jgi:hypothetical protein
VLPLELPELEPDPPLLDPLEPPLDPPLDDEDPEPPDPPLEPEGPVPWVLPHATRRLETQRVATQAAMRTVMDDRQGEHAGCQGARQRDSRTKRRFRDAACRV